MWWPGVLFVMAGEGLRLWAVGHIGLPSRTRGNDLGVLVRSGPFRHHRNPLYVGNVLLFVGVGLWSGWPWALGWIAWFGVQYGLIVGWEERLLSERMGEAYRDYCNEVPRWLPSGRLVASGRWNWRAAIRSERSTLLAIALVVGVFGWV